MTYFKRTLFGLFLLILLGTLVPEKIQVTVAGAVASDWNQNTFWYEPWGSSGVHKGVDIFGKVGTAVISAVDGFVIYKGHVDKGGNVVAVLGPKWRIHYYAHLKSDSVSTGQFVERREVIGTLGDSGNAQGKPAHVHYSILSLLPHPWLVTTEPQGWKRMFYLDPDAILKR
ncbi:M23 family metallopeptidase [Pseudoalteromonas luteoviolacea]|uniref:M23ase beta-sheet core domain-containing protein n=1 Tax=Pseudoalteromonas luteoviolacea NCIMB 1942 TaxID=1365253 RepID=A0A167DHH2_9GAMM|nr:M23 family metallopeptidase [Pseudoalteromonas luteoviolacea]KZN48846.1 hypothetical protein N482_06845 [Pseudoalteromonas luteoviolacea NCIMB 1942]